VRVSTDDQKTGSYASPLPMDVSNSYQPVTTGFAINSLGKAKWSLSCAHSLNT
jgi:hypothetical protein